MMISSEDGERTSEEGTLSCTVYSFAKVGRITDMVMFEVN